MKRTQTKVPAAGRRTARAEVKLSAEEVQEEELQEEELQEEELETERRSSFWEELPGDEKLVFRDRLPEEVRQELPVEIRKQYFLWDEILKREAELYPYLLLPLIEEIFHKSYPKDTPIVFLATEYVVGRTAEKDGQTLHSVYSDLVFRVGDGDIYHLECQMRRNRRMAVRMMEYDMHIALGHDTEAGRAGKAERADEAEETDEAEEGEAQMFLPHSAILYLEHSRNTPDYEGCLIHFQDGGSYQFRVPVLKVQNYTPEQVEKKRLFLLIPFLPIRFRKRLKRRVPERKENIEKELTEFIKTCMIILDRQMKNGVLEESARNDIVEFLWKACAELFQEMPDLLKEVQEIMKPVIRLMRDDIEELQQEIEVYRRENEKYREESEKNRKESEENLLKSEAYRKENEKLQQEIARLRAQIG